MKNRPNKTTQKRERLLWDWEVELTTISRSMRRNKKWLPSGLWKEVADAADAVLAEWQRSALARYREPNQ